jgi:hypothetical protein
VIPPKAWCLVTRNKASVKAYICFVLMECQRHQIQRRLNNIARDIQMRPVSPTHLAQLERIGVQWSDIQRKGERQGRKTVKPHLPFSPPIRGIGMRLRAYTNLVVWHNKGGGSGGNVFRATWRAGIENPRALTLSECMSGVKACKQLMAEQEDKAGLL